MFFSKRNKTKKASKTIDTQHQYQAKRKHTESVSKLSHIFHRFTNTITPHHRHVLKRPCIPKLGSFFRSDSQLQTFDKGSSFTKDMSFERRRYQQNMQTQRQLKDDGYATLSQKEYPEYSSSGPSLIGSQVPPINHNVPSILINRPSLTTTPSLDETARYQPEFNKIEKRNSNASSSKSINSKHISINNNKSTSSHSSVLHENGKSNASMKESPNLTTHSGDLTARQFANIAGIKILSENGDDDDDNDDSNNCEWEGDGNSILQNHGGDGQATTLSNMSKGALLDQDKLSAGTSSSILTLNYSTTSNGSSGHKQQPQIWDSAFWNDTNLESVAYSKALAQRKLSAPMERRHYYQHHHNLQPHQQQHQRQAKSQQQCQHPSETTILHELRRINTISNDHLVYHHQQQQQHHRQIPLRRNRSYVIKKGRFEVSIETSDTADTTEMDTKPVQT